MSVALVLLVAFLVQGTWALAGTTGGLRGTLVDEAGTPVADAHVTAQSQSQTAIATTDQSGRFLFLSLAPDTYTVSVAKQGYTDTSLSGVTIFADQTQSIALRTTKSLTTIARVVSRASGDLVKRGVASDIYSVNAATQATIAGIGGGGNLNSAYSGIYTTPGVSSYIGNYGYGQVFYIRGASYGETGYEFDGIPVNRAFDNYNGNSLSSLGQQELQVYTGGSPAGSSSATLGGFINQVIKTGTYPGSGSGTFGLGTPTFNHLAQVEAGGASPNRMFSYYVGVQGYNQGYRVLNNKDGGNISADGLNQYGFTGTSSGSSALFDTGFFTIGTFPGCNADGTAPAGAPRSAFDGVSPECYQYGPYAAGINSLNQDRENVVNLHFGIPHKRDGGRDDIQLLYDGSAYHSVWSDSINDLGGIGNFNAAYSQVGGLCAIVGAYSNAHRCAGASGGQSPIPYMDSYIFAPGTSFGQSAATATTIPYFFPNSPTNRSMFAGIPLAQRDAIWNDTGVVKLQYQKNISSNAYARLYGYTFYSDWLHNGPNEASLYYGLGGTGFGASGDYPSPDYELNTHTRGVEFQLADQINAQNLLQLTANYTTANVNRFNNTTWNGITLGSSATNLTNGDPNNPICYNYITGAQGSCFSSSTSGTYGDPTRSTACAARVAAGRSACVTPAGASFIVTRPSGSGTLNNVRPQFASAALQDEFKPNDKLDLTLGVRLERYEYDLQNANTPENNFFFNAASKSFCYDPNTQQPILSNISITSPPPAGPIMTAPGAPCPAAPSDPSGATLGVHPDGQNGHLLYTAVSPNSLTKTIFSPRVGGTYTLNPDTVLRFSLGKYTQPTPTAFEQYLNQSGKAASTFDFARFFGFGFNTTAHDNPVQVSNNADFSVEHHFKHTDMTMKISPFYRYTTHQSVSVPLGPNFVSAVNLGTQRSSGVEFQIQKGDPSRDGWAGLLSYTYTNARIKYENAPNGRNAIDTLNDYINAFNALTSAGGGAKCYDPTVATANGANAPDPTCAKATSVSNPYYGMAPGGTLDRNGYYPTYVNAPPGTAPDFSGSGAISPNFFTGYVQYKRNKLAIAPNFVLAQGPVYGSPTSVIGVDPRTCSDNQAGANGNTVPEVAGSQLPNFYSCGQSLATANGFLAIPNPQTGSFDGVGKYQQPWQLNIGAHVNYALSPKVSASLDLSNLLNRCFGGSSTAWSSAYKPSSYVCGYGQNGGGYIGATPGAGFFLGNSPTAPTLANGNGTTPYPGAFNQPYAPLNGNLPFQAYFQVQIKL